MLTTQADGRQPLKVLLPFQRKGYIYGLRDGSAFLSIFKLCRSRKLLIMISTTHFQFIVMIAEMLSGEPEPRFGFCQKHL